MAKTKVLFVCIHNSARSQMAEAFLNTLARDKFDARSAGLEPGRLNPVVVDIMREEGIDISANMTKSVFDMLEKGEQFDYVITVCDETKAEACPNFPGSAAKIHWGFEDPSSLTGSKEEIYAKTRQIKDAVKLQVTQWVTNFK